MRAKMKTSHSTGTVDYLVPPVVAFCVVGLVNILLIQANAFWASVILSFPVTEFTTFAIIALIHCPLTTIDRKTFGATSGTAAIGMIATIGWLVSMYYLLYIRNDISFWNAIGVSLAVWVFLMFFYFIFMCGSPIAISSCVNMGGNYKLDI